MSIATILLAVLLAGLSSFTMHPNDVGGGPSGVVQPEGVGGGGLSGRLQPDDVGGGPSGSPHP